MVGRCTHFPRFTRILECPFRVLTGAAMEGTGHAIRERSRARGGPQYGQVTHAERKVLIRHASVTPDRVSRVPTHVEWVMNGCQF